MPNTNPLARAIGAPPLAPIARRMVGDDVLDALRTAVMDGAFAPGERLAEAVLARELRVSRAPVREAMLRLEREGLLDFDERGSARVTRLGPKDIEEIYTLRLALEPVAARRVAERGERETFATLSKNIAATARAKTLAEVSRLDAEFHETIICASGHQRLVQCWAGLGHQVLLWFAQMQREHQALSNQTRNETVVAHRELLEALRSGKGATAVEAMHSHIVGWREWLPLEALS